MTGMQIPPYLIGQMASLGNTDEPIDACASCLRALIYGVTAHVGALGVALGEFDLDGVMAHWRQAANILLDFAKVDLASVADLSSVSDEEFPTVLQAFMEARVEHYVDSDTGEVIFEPHGEAGGDLTGVAG